MGGNKQGIFALWLKQFVAVVFTQSFQAIFLVFCMQVMAKCVENVSEITVDTGSLGFVDPQKKTGYLICSIVAYISVTALVKLEKLIKQIFAVEDSPLLGDMGKNMKELMHSAKHFMDMKGRLTDSYKQLGNAKNERKRIDTIHQRKMANGALSSGGGGSSPLGGKGSVKPLDANVNVSQLGEAISGAMSSASKRGDDYWANDSRFSSDGKELTDEQYYQKQKLMADQQVDYSRRKALLQTLSTIGSIGVANGGSDSLEEALHSASYLDQGLMAGGNAVAKAQSNRAAQKNVAAQIKANNEEIERIKDTAVKNNRAGKSNSYGIASQQKKIVDEYNKVLNDFNKEIDKGMIDGVKDIANQWKEMASTINKVSAPPRVTKNERKIINDNAKKYKPNDNDNK